MNTFEYNQFTDAYIPYMVYPHQPFWEEVQIIRRLPVLTRWMVCRALFSF